jgi:hypothetical protein
MLLRILVDVDAEKVYKRKRLLYTNAAQSLLDQTLYIPDKALSGKGGKWVLCKKSSVSKTFSSISRTA